MGSQAVLRDENEQLRARVDHQQTHIAQLEELIRTLRHRHFGASSEQLAPNQASLFDEADAQRGEVPTADEPSPSTRPHRRHNGRPRLSDELPRVEVIYEIEASERICHEHGCALLPMGQETSEQLEFIPAHVRVIRSICKTYTCPQCEGHVVTAKKPPAPIPKSVATPSLLAWIAVSKYVDALPLYRQCEIFKRIGFDADRTTLANWMMTCGRLIQPLINLLWDELRVQPYLHMDETTVQVLAEPGRTPQSKSYMWVSAAGPPGARVVLFDYHPSRSAQVAKTLLADYTGALMVDGYEGYEPACQANGIRRLGCWAHARRRFVEAQRLQRKGKTGKPDQALAWIGQLYAIERSLKQAPPAVRYEARQHQAKPVLDNLRSWLDKTLLQTPPKTALGKALTYLDNQWPRLVAYLEDGRYPIDNNRAENAIRPFVIGRKNWLFSQSTRGAKASANLYGLIETAKANDLDPMDYLMKVFTELPKATSVDDIAALLPANVNNGV